MRTFSLFLLSLLFGCQSVFVWSQQETEAPSPVFTCDEMEHDFGKIRETEKYAFHEFVVKNTGSAPLIISRVLSSCGCAQPEWSTKPIEPGQEGFVIISYDMVNRPGPFSKNITVFTNEKAFRRVLTIKGDVIPRPETLNVLFRDTIGTVQTELVNFIFHKVRPHQVLTTDIWIQNFGKDDLTLSIEDIPEFVNITFPTRLESNFPEKLIVELDAGKVDENRRGRELGHFTWRTESASGEIITQSIPVAVNFIDDFSGISAAERENSPSIQLSTPRIDYGKLKNKRVYKELALTNTGKSTLNLHSVTIDDSIVAQITGLKKHELQPGETQKLRIYVNPKNVKSSFLSSLYIISNDPREPVRDIEITFEK